MYFFCGHIVRLNVQDIIIFVCLKAVSKAGFHRTLKYDLARVFASIFCEHHTVPMKNQQNLSWRHRVDIATTDFSLHRDLKSKNGNRLFENLYSNSLTWRVPYSVVLI